MKCQRLLLGLAVVVMALPADGIAQQTSSGSQQPPRPGVIMVSSQKCALDAPPKIDSVSKLAFYPILDEMVKEGRLINWGTLTHDWGDEWNFVIYYTATSSSAFFNAWNEIVRRLDQRRPQFLLEFSRLCTEHKDNLYAVMHLSAPVVTQ
jgi:hypothetical protein